ncbi:MAG: imidazole glycerol phosphate synthase subunit HisH [Candidatus Nealsonbacteria bacterium CG08_land_8_20_14_0_20_38_20]|uniref:Imidazole glycerol phosphate synthase subunit HisH n=1 Tax=Candidatus Nealsonbacteria bacterium CG08_land_8_20_14_0_20_38_20 TaxID=1974705 RepID=A0A2H0YLW0_9BACT|nr:MAG: imidazole glycerol phosphate synthase subunit HisH [Candidatus Nealsonbacteria bacterium CG08_land_8_20_14_0_20_38_20]
MIAIIDYKAGNIASVKNALERLRFDWIVTSQPEEILSAGGVIFPGQGRAGAAMSELRKTGLDKIISQITKPFLGICLGMQLLSRYSEEDETKCIGIFKGKCRKFPPTLKTPHLGWNKVELNQESSLTAGIPDGQYFYFAHSYYVDAVESQIIGKTSYGFDFSSIMQKNNFFAVQFHPEKSGPQGLRLLNNFCKLCS